MLSLSLLCLLGLANASSDLSSQTIKILNFEEGRSLRELRAQGDQAMGQLVDIAFSAEQKTEMRWRALLRLARLEPVRSRPALERAYGSSTWFMRSAALRAMVGLDPEQARTWAHSSLSDAALVVRTSAVDVLKQVGDQSTVPLLWQSLYDANNYRSGTSLWVRRHIVEALARLARSQQDVSRFISLLDDRDHSLQRAAIVGLEQLTGRRLGREHEPSSFKAVYWKEWWFLEQSLVRR